ncbi:MAG: hypothetical protein WA197_14705 [Candidatus Acidiferrales bacterium]
MGLFAGRTSIPKSKATHYKKDRRRKHHHWLVTVTYTDNETFGRVYLDRERAEKFAARQKKSPVVLKTGIGQLS